MIKTILVPIDGTPAPTREFETAVSLARTLAAHLSFFYERSDAYDAAARSIHLDFCDDKEISRAMLASRLTTEQLLRSARGRFDELCSGNDIQVTSTPNGTTRLTAAFIEGKSRTALLYHARHNDLIVLTRPVNTSIIRNTRIGQLLMNSGRPVIIVSEMTSPMICGTIVVGWKECPEAARALSTAMPLLQAARRVIVMHVAEDEDESPDGVHDVLSQLAWHGIEAEARFLTETPRKPVVQLTEAALENQAGLMVIGGYGHTPWSEGLLGGVTHTLIQHANFPVFLTH